MDNKIKFYSADWCGFCKRAKEMLKNEIDNGIIVVLPHSEAKGASGFPHFEYNGKTHTGLPSSPDKLKEALGYKKESFHREAHHPVKPEHQLEDWMIGVM